MTVADERTCDECGERIGEDDVRHVECHSCHVAFDEVAESERAERDKAHVMLARCQQWLVMGLEPDSGGSRGPVDMLLADIEVMLGDCGCRHGFDPGGGEHSFTCAFHRGETP